MHFSSLQDCPWAAALPGRIKLLIVELQLINFPIFLVLRCLPVIGALTNARWLTACRSGLPLHFSSWRLFLDAFFKLAIILAGKKGTGTYAHLATATCICSSLLPNSPEALRFCTRASSRPLFCAAASADPRLLAAFAPQASPQSHHRSLRLRCRHPRSTYDARRCDRPLLCGVPAPEGSARATQSPRKARAACASLWQAGLTTWAADAV